MSKLKEKLKERVGNISDSNLQKIENFIANNLQDHQIESCIELLSDILGNKCKKNICSCNPKIS